VILSRRNSASPAGLLRIAACLALASCATTNLSPLGAGGKPFQREQDEKQIWQNAEQLERRIDESGMRYKGPQLDAYLTAVTQTLLPADVQALGLGPRVKVIQHPFLNAFALPNGAIYLHTGILARMENEAQLATVLGQRADPLHPSAFHEADAQSTKQDHVFWRIPGDASRS